jgi:hypothetical protein
MQIDMISKKELIMLWIHATLELVDSQINYNQDGKIFAIPIMGYHDIDNNKTITSTDVNLFDAEMKYLWI